MQASKPITSSLDCLSDVEAAFGSQLLNMDFGQRELNTEVCLLLDAVRKEQSSIEEKLPSLWRELFKKLRKRDSSIPDSERKLATSLVFDSVFVLLACSNDVFYSYELATYVHDADEQNNPDGCEERIRRVLEALEPHEEELTGWIERHLAMTPSEALAETEQNTAFGCTASVGHPTHAIEECIMLEDKQSVIEQMKQELDKRSGGPEKAFYIDSLVQDGTLSKFPSHSAFEDAGLITLSKTAWNSATKPYRDTLANRRT